MTSSLCIPSRFCSLIVCDAAAAHPSITINSAPLRQSNANSCGVICYSAIKMMRFEFNHDLLSVCRATGGSGSLSCNQPRGREKYHFISSVFELNTEFEVAESVRFRGLFLITEPSSAIRNVRVPPKVDMLERLHLMRSVITLHQSSLHDYGQFASSELRSCSTALSAAPSAKRHRSSSSSSSRSAPPHVRNDERTFDPLDFPALSFKPSTQPPVSSLIHHHNAAGSTLLSPGPTLWVRILYPFMFSMSDPAQQRY